MSLIECFSEGKRPATDKDMSRCGYCKKPFKKDEKVYMKGEGWKGVVIMDNKCRKKFHPKLKITQ